MAQLTEEQLEKRKKTNKKILKFFLYGLAIYLLFGVLGMLMPKPSGQAAKQNAGVSQKIIDLGQRASGSKDRTRDIKIIYDITLSEKDISSTSQDEAKDLLTNIFFADKEHDCCENAFINLRPEGVESLYFLSGQTDKEGKFKISTSGFSWESHLCGLKIATDQRNQIKQKIRWLKSETDKLANDFILAYESGENLGTYKTKSTEIYGEWDNFIGETFKGTCTSMIYYPESNAKTKAISILNAIETAGTYFDKDKFIKDYQAMNSVQL